MNAQAAARQTSGKRFDLAPLQKFGRSLMLPIAALPGIQAYRPEQLPAISTVVKANHVGDAVAYRFARQGKNLHVVHSPHIALLRPER